MKVCPPCDQLLDVAQPPIAIAASKGLPVFSTPKHSTKSLRIAATTICFGLRRPRDFNRVTSAAIAGLYRMADRAGMYSAARRTAKCRKPWLQSLLNRMVLASRLGREE